MTYHIYLIHAPEVNKIKIGLSNNVKRSLKEVATYSPCPVILLTSWPGNKKDLQALQVKYQRKYQDWFEVHPELLALRTKIETNSSSDKNYQDISFLCEKYSISQRKLNRIINWVESSQGINLHDPIYSTPADQNETWIDRHFTSKAVTMLEIGIVNYSRKHPRANIRLNHRLNLIPGWE